MSRLILKICVILLCGTFSAHAQQYHCKVHDTGRELAEMKPSLMYRDSFGLLWLGTSKGLVRYDGENLEIFNREDTLAGMVTSLYAVEGVLLVGYDDGNIYTFQNEALSPLVKKYSNHNAKITGIRKLANGHLIISTYGSGILLITDDGKMIQYGAAEGILSDEIYCLEQIDAQSVVIGTDQGIQLIRVAANDIDCTIPAAYDTLKDEVVLHLSWGVGSNILLAGTFENGLITISGNDIHVRKYLNDKTIIGMSSGLNNTHYILTDDKAHFYTLDADRESMQTIKICVSEEVVPVSLLCDSTGLLWFTCSRTGLWSIDSRFFHYSLPVNTVQAIAVLDSTIYFADGKGLYTMDFNGQWRLLVNNLNILAIHADTKTGRLFCGTFGTGILVYDSGMGSQYFITEKDGLVNNNVISVVQTKDEIWAATLGGISILNTFTGNFRHLTKADGLTTGYTYSLFTDSKQNIWVGSDGFGLIRFDAGGQKSEIPSRHSIISIAEGRNSDMWYSTTDNVLYRVPAGQKEPVPVRDGLYPGVIAGISNDSRGNIYVFHPGSIDVIRTDKGIITNYGHNQYFKEINKLLHGLASDTDGHIWFSDEGKIVRFTPPVNALEPGLFIKHIYGGNTLIMQGPENVLNPADNDIQVEYTGIWYDNPTALKYRYKLSGFSENWIYTRDKKLIFPNLAPGQYTFTLESDIHGGFNFPARLSRSFTILTPFYKTYWFFALLVVSALSVFYFFVHARDRRQQHIQQLTTDKVRSELEMIKSQIDPHFLFNSFNTLISAIETEPKDALKFAERMSDFYRTILDYRDKDFIPLSEEIALCKNYIYLLQARFGSNLIINKHIPDTDNYLIIPLTLQIVIENAVKHNIVSNQKPLNIDIIQKGDYLYISNPVQLRRDKTPSTHFGLEALIKRFRNFTDNELIAGLSGGIFEVRIPLIRTDEK